MTRIYKKCGICKRKLRIQRQPVGFCSKCFDNRIKQPRSFCMFFVAGGHCTHILNKNYYGGDARIRAKGKAGKCLPSKRCISFSDKTNCPLLLRDKSPTYCTEDYFIQKYIKGKSYHQQLKEQMDIKYMGVSKAKARLRKMNKALSKVKLPPQSEQDKAREKYNAYMKLYQRKRKLYK